MLAIYKSKSRFHLQLQKLIISVNILLQRLSENIKLVTYIYSPSSETNKKRQKLRHKLDGNEG